jgi:tetratricopeptide (TPR) repeat protein
MELGRYDEAIAEHRRVMEIRRQAFGEGGALEGIDLSKLARVYARKGDYATADSLFGQALANQRRYVPDTHPDVREIYRLISERYRLQGRQPDAQRYAVLSQPR